MFTIQCVESYIDKDNLDYGCFKIEPLDGGHSITIGNTLRRILLSELIGPAITSVRINNIKHEFSAISGVREDVLDIILNLKEIRFRGTKHCATNLNLQVIGPSVITAEQLITPSHLEVVNKKQYIATVHDSTLVEMELKIEYGKGYCFASQNTSVENEDDFLMVDANFSPIRRVNYKIKLLPLDGNQIKESLIFEIWTDGSITPARSLKEASKLAMNLFYPLLSHPYEFK